MTVGSGNSNSGVPTGPTPATSTCTNGVLPVMASGSSGAGPIPHLPALPPTAAAGTLPVVPPRVIADSDEVLQLTLGSGRAIQLASAPKSTASPVTKRHVYDIAT